MIFNIFNMFGIFVLKIAIVWICLELFSGWVWNTCWVSERRIEKVMLRAARRARRPPSWFVGVVVGATAALLWGSGPSTLGLDTLLSRPLEWVVVGLVGTLFLWIGCYKVVGMMVFFIPGHRRILSAITTFFVVKWGCLIGLMMSYSAWLIFQIITGVLTIAQALSSFAELVKGLF